MCGLPFKVGLWYYCFALRKKKFQGCFPCIYMCVSLATSPVDDPLAYFCNGNGANVVTTTASLPSNAKWFRTTGALRISRSKTLSWQEPGSSALEIWLHHHILLLPKCFSGETRNEKRKCRIPGCSENNGAIPGSATFLMAFKKWEQVQISSEMHL